MGGVPHVSCIGHLSHKKLFSVSLTAGHPCKSELIRKIATPPMGKKSDLPSKKCLALITSVTADKKRKNTNKNATSEK